MKDEYHGHIPYLVLLDWDGPSEVQIRGLPVTRSVFGVWPHRKQTPPMERINRLDASLALTGYLSFTRTSVGPHTATDWKELDSYVELALRRLKVQRKRK